ncbi:MAG: peroxiredoxin [bacterium]
MKTTTTTNVRWWVLGVAGLVAIGTVWALAAGAEPVVSGTTPSTTTTAPAAEEVTLKVGDVAPDFTLPGTDATSFTLSKEAGKHAVILIFYPKDFTSVCTKQLCQMRDDYAALTTAGAIGFGINNNALATHEEFQEANKYPFPLLVDTDLAIAAKYGAARDGQPFVDRTVVIVGKSGKVIFYAKGVPSTADQLAAITAEK